MKMGSEHRIGSYASSPPKNMDDFWPKQQAKIDQMTQTNFREVNRHSELPIARIKVFKNKKKLTLKFPENHED